MGLGTSNRTALRYIAEVTFGTTPATPALKDLRYTGESLAANISTVRSNEIRSDRNVSDLIRTGSEAGGDIDCEMSYGSYDDFIEAVCAGTWTANVVKNGVTAKSFTVQRHFTDAGSGAGIFNQFRGARIDSWDLEVQQGQVITSKWGIKALSMDVTTTQIVGATIVPATTTQVLSSQANVADVEEDDVNSTEFFRKLSLSIKNNLRPQRAISSIPAIGIAYGTCDITGALEIYFANEIMLNRYINGTGFKLSFEMVDGATKYLVELPKVKFESGTVVSGGLDQDIMYSGNIRALYDSVTQAQIVITRTP